MELTNKNIGAVIDDIRAFFEKERVSRKDVIKICLVVEESLLRYQEKFGAAHEFKLYKKKKMVQHAENNYPNQGRAVLSVAE